MARRPAAKSFIVRRRTTIRFSTYSTQRTMCPILNIRATRMTDRMLPYDRDSVCACARTLPEVSKKQCRRARHGFTRVMVLADPVLRMCASLVAAKRSPFRTRSRARQTPPSGLTVYGDTFRLLICPLNHGPTFWQVSASSSSLPQPCSRSSASRH